jgi:translation initiation factor 2 beta subunit (eIF-2beta)/eIF-5
MKKKEDNRDKGDKEDKETRKQGEITIVRAGSQTSSMVNKDIAKPAPTDF